MAVAVCASHRIFDAGSMSIFLTAWSSIATRDSAVTPVFDSASFFPSENLAPLQTHNSRTRNKNIAFRRFIFTKTAISELRRRMPTAAGQKPPSKVAVVSAALIQALLRADRAKHGESRACVIAQAINVRGRTVPPVSAHSCGNWATFSTLELGSGQAREMERDFPGLVSGMRGAAADGVADCRRLLSDREFGRWALVGSYVEADERGEAGECKVVWVSDWSKFGDYEVDLGVGKADWVSLAGGRLEDILVLMGTKDKEGIEAWVSLQESEMRIVEADQDIRKLTAAPESQFRSRGLSKM